ncbi:MAG: glycosyltransferase [Planctomycetota bacterium]
MSNQSKSANRSKHSNQAPFGRPLRTMFLLTSMPIGGAETLLVNLVRGFDRNRIEPIIGCMKEQDVLGEELANEIPVFENLLRHKYDFAVAGRLKQLFLKEKIDALVTVGAGDKMFWGRLGARRARLPVILSALHSTGWPDGVGRLNRMLTGITDGFIAVARQHAKFQIEHERFPAEKVFLVPNGIDTDRFTFCEDARTQWRNELSINHDVPVIGIVAALRPEKNHDLFIEAARRVSSNFADAQFVIVGDGPERLRLEALAKSKGVDSQVRFIGATHDIPGALSMMDVFALTSHNEASPVSIMEALSCQRPIVATDVGSIDESVINGTTGFLVEPDDAQAMARRWIELIREPKTRETFGRNGREHIIQNSSLHSMTDGYTRLLETTFAVKTKSKVNLTSTIAPTSSLPDGWVNWDYKI